MQRDRMTWGKVAKWFGCSVIAMTVTVFTAWVTSPDPRFNPASFEDQPLVQGLAPLEQAITLAQFRAPNGSTRTLLVLARDGENVTGIDLAELGAPSDSRSVCGAGCREPGPGIGQASWHDTEGHDCYW